MEINLARGYLKKPGTSKIAGSLNRLNRNKLKNQNNVLVSSISVDDYFLQKDDSNNLDLFLILKK